jgi:hypothetical protein
MGQVVKAIGSLLGSSAPKANVQSAIDTVSDEENKAKKARSALIQNVAGQAGAQLQPGQTQPGSNLFGN